MNNKQYFTAIHEAGHAVISVILGQRFNFVTIEPSDDANGHIQYCHTNLDLQKLLPEYYQEDIDEELINTKVRNHISITLAGYLCELQLGVQNSEGAVSDFNSVIDLAFRHKGDGDLATEFVSRCEEFTIALIQQNWHFILNVVELLLREKTLAEEKVLKVCSKSS